MTKWRAVGLATLFFARASSALSPAEALKWREDLRFMAGEMEKTHKNAYHSISRTDFSALVSALDEKIPSLGRDEVIVEMAKIVAAVHDGHTNIYPTRDPKIGFHELPVQFTFFGRDLYVRAADAAHGNLVGARVVRIGDQDVQSAYALVARMIGSENNQGARYWAQYLLAMPEVLEAFHVVSSRDEVALTVETGHGETTAVLRDFEPVPIMTGDVATLFNRRKGWIDARDLSGREDPSWLRHTDEPFHFEHAGNVLYVQINQVTNGPRGTLARFAERVRDEIVRTRPEKAAIDLRLNRGGDGTLIVPLVRALVQSTEIDRKGRLFGIIGPATFSAAQMLVDALEKYTNITFVGEPTGSRGNTYGDSRKIVLPNSGITVRAAIYWWQDWYPWDTRDATVPQLPAPLTFEDYRQQIDPALRLIEAQQPVP
ncbi:MAG TPA: hypothetical protein VFL12_07650 [Thermoanaerobaculia bacterium]|nr:hypothetical protein [Thermoanaerobaculia bacterium]